MSKTSATKFNHTSAADLAERWGDPAARLAVRWPINMRIGRV